MSAVVPTLQAFFTDRLLRQRQASPRTVTAYRDSLRLLVTWIYDTMTALIEDLPDLLIHVANG